MSWLRVSWYGFLAVTGGLVGSAETGATRVSPFQPVGQKAAPPVTENAQIEFRGFVVMGGRKQFNFFDRGKNKSTWVSLNDSATGVLVRNYDPANDTVQVDYEGRPLTLTLEKPKIGSAPAPTIPAPIPMAGNVTANMPPAPPPVVLNPTPADEAKRLEAIAAEVRRRRALRQQGTGTQAVPVTQ